VVELRGIDRERDPVEALTAGAVQVQHLLVVAAEVHLVLVDQGLEVEPLVGERGRAANPERSDDVRWVPGRDLHRERVAGSLISRVVDLDRDVGVRRLERLGEVGEGLLLALLVAAAEAAEPGQRDLARRQGRWWRGGRGAGWSGRARRRGRAGRG